MTLGEIFSNGSIDRVIDYIISIGVLLFIFISLIIRARNPRSPTWSYMAFASFVVVVSGLLPIDEVASSIDLEVVLFLIGMFAIAAIAESSGLLDYMTWRIISFSRDVYSALILFSLSLGIAASIAVNDTMAVIGVPIVYTMSRALGVDPKVLSLLLMYSITIGSVATTIGNPQNMLIATRSGLETPFIDFIRYLLIPTILNLILSTYIIVKLYKIRNRRISIGLIPQEYIRNRREALIGGTALASVVIILVVNDVAEILGGPHIRYIGFIPFVIAAGAFLILDKPREVLRTMDWGTVIFFMTMFITMQGIWRSGVVQTLLQFLAPLDTQDPLRRIVEIESTSLILSQFTSNVPYVKLFLNYVSEIHEGLSVREWISLAMSSTVAGNLTLLGAASNIIVLEALESRYKISISAIEFMKVGALITVINLVIYNLFLLLTP
ncbi:MAG: SLC13 family permease [Sulfolobales archaeon]